MEFKTFFKLKVFMKTILVTGGAGFIGSHTCVVLLKKGFNVVIVDSFINSSKKVINKIKEICFLENIKSEKKINVFNLAFFSTKKNVFFTGKKRPCEERARPTTGAVAARAGLRPGGLSPPAEASL